MVDSTLLDDIVAEPGLELETLLSGYGYSAEDDSETYDAVYGIAEELSDELAYLTERKEKWKEKAIKLGQKLDYVMPVVWPTLGLGRRGALMGYVAYSGPAYLAGAGLFMGGVFGVIGAGIGAFLGIMIRHYLNPKVTAHLAERFAGGYLEKRYLKKAEKEYAGALSRLEEIAAEPEEPEPEPEPVVEETVPKPVLLLPPPKTEEETPAEPVVEEEEVEEEE